MKWRNTEMNSSKNEKLSFRRKQKLLLSIGNCNLLEQSLAENQFQWKIVISNNRAW